MALPYDQIEALAHKLAVADIGADDDEQVMPNARAVVGELDRKDLVTVVEIAVEIAEYKQEKLEQVLDEIRTDFTTRDRWGPCKRSTRGGAQGHTQRFVDGSTAAGRTRRLAPITEQLILSFIAEMVLDLPKATD